MGTRSTQSKLIHEEWDVSGFRRTSGDIIRNYHLEKSVYTKWILESDHAKGRLLEARIET